MHNVTIRRDVYETPGYTEYGSERIFLLLRRHVLCTRAKGDDAYRLYEQFVEAGGNLFDTAHGYACWMPDGDGASERTLGDCLQKFGNRKDMVISTKGALIQTLPFYPRPDDTMTAEVIGSDISSRWNGCASIT